MFKHVSARNLFINIFQCIFEYLLLFPLYLMFAIYNMGFYQMLLWLGFILLLYFFGVIYRTLFYKQSGFVYGLLAFGIGVISALFFTDSLVIKILLSIAHTIFMFRGMMYTARARHSLLSTAFLWLGGPINYFICFFFYYYLDALQSYLFIFSLAGFITISLILFIANNDHLRAATLSRDAKPFISRPIKRQNRVFLGVTIVLIFLAASLDLFRRIFWRIVYVFRAIIQWVLFAGSTVRYEDQPQPSRPERPLIPSVVEGESAPKIFVFLGIIILYATYVFIFIVLIMLLLLLIKRTRQSVIWFIKQIIAFLKRLRDRIFMKAEDPVQYTDEKENIFDWDEWQKEQQDRFRKFMQEIFTREPKWEDLSNEEKVRFAYRFLVENKGKKYYAPSLTPREVLNRMQKIIKREDERVVQKLKEAYERTRYGEQSIDDQTVEELYFLIQRR